tara:strand:- start:479 stop:724 length:246 start_codon:yes stop_codon:yes gene_type:complete
MGIPMSDNRVNVTNLVLREKLELEEKIDKLEKFILSGSDVWDSMGENHQHLLIVQLDTMKSYRTILELRLNLLENDLQSDS